MAEGLVARWLKKDGEWVRDGEPVVEVETDKIVYEVEAPTSGLLHRIVAEDAIVPVNGVVGYLLERGEATPEGLGNTVTSTFAARDVPVTGDYEVLPMRSVRKVVSDNMVRSLQMTAQYTICLDADVTEIGRRRKELFEGPQKLRVSLVDVAIKASAEVLRRYPRLNAVWVGDEVRICKEINISFAVALDEGLVVPVVRHADRKNLVEISWETKDLAQRARSNKLTLDEIRGGTFSVTAPGYVDVCTPILNYPQCGILGLGRVVERPSVYQGQIVPRSIVTLSLSLDHRVVDGAPAAAFLRRLQRLLEEPARLFDGL